MMEAIMGMTDEGILLGVDLDKLIGSHLAIVANSGGGKSGAIRKLLEETHGHIQHIVLDVEDDFYTLRERFDYLVAGGDGGDCPAKVKDASALATMLLTHSISAVIQLNDLHAYEQEEFIRIFLETLMSAPKEIWHPVLVVVDEAHRFAPQEGRAASSDAVRDLTARGRKRGFTGVLATQRMAKIDKNVTGDINNWLLGRVGQATDRRVVADALGFGATSKEAREMQGLPARTFYAFGVALAPVPVKVVIDEVLTTMPKPGQAKVATMPPPEALREILAQMVQEAAAAAAATAVPDKPVDAAEATAGVDLAAIRDEARREGYGQGVQDGRTEGAELAAQHAVRALDDVVERFRQSLLTGSPLMPDEGRMPDMRTHFVMPDPKDAIARVDLPVTLKDGDSISFGLDIPTDHRPRSGPEEISPVWSKTESTVADSPVKLMGPVKQVITTLENMWPASMTFLQAAKHAGVGLKSSNFRLYEPQLKASGKVEIIGDRYRAKITKPTGVDILDAYAARLSPAYRGIFNSIRKASAPVTREYVLNQTGISPTSSTFTGAMALLIKDLEIVERVGDTYRLAEVFRR
jgi:hypothetical protein